MKKKDQNYIVYIHRNKINGKEYVGISKNTAEFRWQKDGKGYNKQIFGKAIQKYGWDNFEHNILHSGLTKDEAIELEQYYINERDTLIPNGYNVTPGGECGSAMPIICIETEKIFHNVEEILEYYGNALGEYTELTQIELHDCLNYERKYVVAITSGKRQILHFQYYNEYLKFPQMSDVSYRIEKIEARCMSKFDDRKWEYRSIYYFGVPDSKDEKICIQTKHQGYMLMCQYCGRLFKPERIEPYQYDASMYIKEEDLYCWKHLSKDERL